MINSEKLKEIRQIYQNISNINSSGGSGIGSGPTGENDCYGINIRDKYPAMVLLQVFIHMMVIIAKGNDIPI